MYHANTNQKKIAGLRSDKVDFKTRNIILDKEKYYIMMT